MSTRYGKVTRYVHKPHWNTWSAFRLGFSLHDVSACCKTRKTSSVSEASASSVVKDDAVFIGDEDRSIQTLHAQDAEMSALYEVVVDHGADLLDVVGLRRCSGKPAPVNDLADGLIRCGNIVFCFCVLKTRWAPSSCHLHHASNGLPFLIRCGKLVFCFYYRRDSLGRC